MGWGFWVYLTPPDMGVCHWVKGRVLFAPVCLDWWLARDGVAGGSRLVLLDKKGCTRGGVVAQKHWTADDLTAAGYTGGRDEVYSITDASAPQSEGVDVRAKSYAFKMFLRIICIIAAVWVGEGIWQWVFLAGAAIIPWLAVVAANGDTRQQGSGFSAFLPEDQRLAIETAQADRAADAEGQAGHTNAGSEDGSEVHTVNHQSSVPENDVIIIEGEIVEPGADQQAQ